MIRLLLRAIAIAIAVAGVIDPSVARSRSTRARVAIVRQDPQSATGVRVQETLVGDLHASFEIVPQITSDSVAAVVIGDRYPVASMPTALRIATVTLPAPAEGVRIVRIDGPREAPPGTAIHLDVDVEGVRVSGRTTALRATIGGLEMGKASHTWGPDRERWHASFDVVPVGAPPYVISIESVARPFQGRAGDGGPGSAALPPAQIVIGARRRPFRVEAFEPRPSWASTFVRRALEADARFAVASLSMSSRGIASRAGEPMGLTDAGLAAFDVVLVGGLDRLSIADAHALDRFMRERGGVVVLLPDARLDRGAARDLLSIDLKEQLLERATTLSAVAPLPGFDASELLVVEPVARAFQAPDSHRDPERVTLHVIARTTGDDAAAVVASVPRGDGRLVWSGAMDAWRFRARDTGAFDRFWQSTVAGLALAVPPPLDVRVEPTILAPGEEGEVVVHARSRAPLLVSATVDGAPIRLRPEPEGGVFRGGFSARQTAGRMLVEARADGASSQAASVVAITDADARRAEPLAARTLPLLSSSHDGVDVGPEHLDAIERWLRTAIPAPRATIIRHPMRSAWWMLPLTLCLSIEWWLRRRRGER